MTDDEKTGGQAFPGSPGSFGPDGETWVPTEGMTLRDYFAGQFLVTVTVEGTASAQAIAKQCYIMADAMLLARR